MALHHSQADIDSCLAYEVLRNPDKWIGGASCHYLMSFLTGANMIGIRDSYLHFWRVHGVLPDHKFYTKLAKEFGVNSLNFNWVSVIQLTHFSFSDGFRSLLREALAWHKEYGVEPLRKNLTAGTVFHTEEVIVLRMLRGIKDKPVMYLSNNTGWDLFCFLNGSVNGVKWLNLPEVPIVNDVFNQIKARSKKLYGSEFGIFHLSDINTILETIDLEWDKIGLSSDS